MSAARPASPLPQLTNRVPASPLKRHRIAIGALQSDVATAARISQVHVSAIESGQRRLTLRIAQRLAPVLGVPCETLLQTHKMWERNHSPIPTVRAAGVDEREHPWPRERGVRARQKARRVA